MRTLLLFLVADCLPNVVLIVLGRLCLLLIVWKNTTVVVLFEQITIISGLTPAVVTTLDVFPRRTNLSHGGNGHRCQNQEL